MGKKQNYLMKICLEEFQEGKHSKPSASNLLNSTYADILKNVYSELNGQLSVPPTRFGPWDIDLRDFIIEFDEERHFNRYRLLTLNSDYYQNNPSFNIDNYKSYCLNYEGYCLKAASWGKNWKNNSTEKQFGQSSAPKVFEGNGSSRWKQRAYYDFLKDISSKIISTPIIRLSIYDTVNNIRIDELINLKRKDILIEYIKLKLSQN